MLDKNKFLIVIGGPTAVGKTSLAIALAKQFDAEIISADSRQIYRKMNIGTAKITPEEQEEIKHHFIDIKDLDEDYSAGQYESDVIQFLDEYYKNKSIAILVGGTGLYINAILNGLDIFPDVPKDVLNTLEEELNNAGLEPLQNELKIKDPVYAASTDLQNSRRVIRALSIIRHSKKTFSSFQKSKQTKRNFKAIPIVLSLSREELYNRINLRVDLMMAEGLLKEVENLSAFKHHRSLNTVGYKELFAYLDNTYSLDHAIEKIKQHSRNYAKRQITWFNNSIVAQHFSPKQSTSIIRYIEEEINS